MDTKEVRKEVKEYRKEADEYGIVGSDYLSDLADLTDECCDELDRLAAELERYKWIPVSERLPDPYDQVLTIYYTEDGIGCENIKVWRDEHHDWVDQQGNITGRKTVTHWQPMPPLPPAPEMMG